MKYDRCQRATECAGIYDMPWKESESTKGKLMSEGFPLKMQLTVRAHTHTFTCKIMTYTERIWKMQNSVLCSATSNLSKLCMMKVDIVKSAPSVARLQCSRWSKIHQDSLLGIVNIPVRLRLWGCDVCDLFWPGRFGRWARLGWSSQARDSHHLPVLDFLMFLRGCRQLSSHGKWSGKFWELRKCSQAFSYIFLDRTFGTFGTLVHFDSVMGHGISLVWGV